MIFNSVTYLAFLALVVPLYWLLPQRARLWLVFISSCVFYGFWRLEFIPLLLFSAAMDYGLALWIERTDGEVLRRRIMVCSVIVNLLILGVFKYLIFFRDAVWSIAASIGYQPTAFELKIILPLGISFYIFATISYVIDVYRREYKAERDFLLYSCFIVFFPHLVAGPILRARSLIPQLASRPAFRLDFLSEGLARIVAGLFLKVVLADSIAGLVDVDFVRDPKTLSAFDAWTLAFLFGFQIYFDFSAYSHIAIGSARLMGIVLPENFDFPYMADSPREFWRRWHISLSTWIRDYLYLPMAGAYERRAPGESGMAPVPGLQPVRQSRVFSLYVTWALMGLWHGANWTFVVWGIYHAVCVHAQRAFGNGSQRLAWFAPIAGWAVTLPLMMAAWVPFRSQSLSQTMQIWSRMIDPFAYRGLSLLFISYVTAAGLLLGMVAVWLIHVRIVPNLARRPALAFGSELIYATVILAFVIIFLRVESQFIYFQF
jgi:alginate O-acetyltransferase complex protein AlgI